MIAAAARPAAQPWQTPAMTVADNLIVVGYAKVPATSASHGVHQLFSVCLRVDRRTGTVIEVDSTAATGLVRSWLAELLLGLDLRGDVTPVLTAIEQNYLGQGGGAIRQAVADAFRRYLRHAEG
ncbi:DUF3870 domain-containing protein [Amycolatopsis thermophila]|uniref:DUF3870 domain-containing protein n=1 Tax=Amycolatopsis thermophila TaxID=206084 RepID=A0ABU0EMA6_9PSEU|nr:DUF3870 domain-containing protein [Amycolatopsis thermophila]MDQ0376176.1 hypothetical protein [Amycolatopsis thermophila]